MKENSSKSKMKQDDVRNAYWIRAQNCIAQGALTNSKHPRSFVYGVYPIHIVNGNKCYLYDINHIKYTDYICGLGTNLFGYGNEIINRKISMAIQKGYSHSLPTVYEIEVAEKLKEIFEFVDNWKFLKSGSESCSAAIRIARAQTGRKKVLSEGYHGWHDEFISLMENPDSGIPEKSKFMDKWDGNLEAITSEIAAVIVEPIITDNSIERINWLNALRSKCDDTGTILIFDEVITGFRYKRFSVSKYYSITPDLIVIGKAMANGMPLAAVGGKREIMNNSNYFVSSTYAGDIVSIGACMGVLECIKKFDFDINNVWDEGQKFIDKFNQNGTSLKLSGYPTRGVFEGNELQIAYFFQEAIKFGLLFGKSWFFNSHHIPETDLTLDFCQYIFSSIKHEKMQIKGEMPSSPFAQKIRENKDD